MSNRLYISNTQKLSEEEATIHGWDQLLSLQGEYFNCSYDMPATSQGYIERDHVEQGHVERSQCERYIRIKSSLRMLSLSDVAKTYFKSIEDRNAGEELALRLFKNVLDLPPEIEKKLIKSMTRVASAEILSENLHYVLDRAEVECPHIIRGLCLGIGVDTTRISLESQAGEFILKDYGWIRGEGRAWIAAELLQRFERQEAAA